MVDQDLWTRPPSISYSIPMRFGRLLRALALSLLAVMLFLRVGPICEAGATAATVSATPSQTMAGCEQAPGKPVKKPPLPNCVGGCIAVDPQPVATAEMTPAAVNRPVSGVHAALESRSGGPAPPPPENVISRQSEITFRGKPI